MEEVDRILEELADLARSFRNCGARDSLNRTVLDNFEALATNGLRFSKAVQDSCAGDCNGNLDVAHRIQKNCLLLVQRVRKLQTLDILSSFDIKDELEALAVFHDELREDCRAAIKLHSCFLLAAFDAATTI